jgi:hypothetical protein
VSGARNKTSYRIQSLTTGRSGGSSSSGAEKTGKGILAFGHDVQVKGGGSTVPRDS